MTKRKILRYSSDNKLTQEVEEVIEKKEDLVQKEKTAKMLSLVSEIGYSVSLPLVGGGFLGQVLDRKFNTSPRITLFLIFLGLALGIYNIYASLKKLKD